MVSFINCKTNKGDLDLSDKHGHNKNNTSHFANYLTANYSINKGDGHTASEILAKNIQPVQLLEIKFFSNLVSGKFRTAERVSKVLKINNEKNDLYKLPQYILNIKNNNIEESLNVLKNQKSLFNLDKLNYLIKFWINEPENKNKLKSEKLHENISIHELLILENFHDSNKLIKIADTIYKNKDLNSHDLLLLAGFYHRAKRIGTSEKIIISKLSDQFDKQYIINNFSDPKNSYYKLPELRFILASKLYNIIEDNNFGIYRNNSYKKILLEFSLFLNPKMDISRYSLAEIYHSEKTNKLALKKLNSISHKSFYFLAANLKKLTIQKTSGFNLKYKNLLFKVVDLWPKNKFALHRLANYYKSKRQYTESIKIYKKILNEHGSNDRDIFLYASNLDKIGKWTEAKTLFFKLLEKNPDDTYSLNYVSYKLALKEQELELALKLVKKALVLDPDNGYFLDTLGWVEFKRKKYNSAVYFLEKSVSILPTSAEVIDHLGDCYLKLNRKKEAIFEWKKALKYETDKSIINKIKQKIIKNEHLL